MAVTIGIICEQTPHEQRVALVPELVKKYHTLGVTLILQTQAGEQSAFLDSAYGTTVTIATDAQTVFAKADIILKVQPPSLAEIAQMRPGAIVLGYLQPHQMPERLQAFVSQNITAFALELLPRTTRAQAMDVLSSQASIAGYKAVLIAAQASSKFFPMLTTAAGTIKPARVLIVGAGVAGLQAIATARRLGAQVEGFDVRPEVKEQIESLGAQFLDLGVSATGAGGYARELTAEERIAQQDKLTAHLKNIDVIVTTAAIPGRPAPKIILQRMVENMKPGSVIVDLAAETGGNCELTKPGETYIHNHVKIIGPLNLPSQAATHASEMYARNLFNFVSLFIKNGEIEWDWQDELLTKTCVAHAGELKYKN